VNSHTNRQTTNNPGQLPNHIAATPSTAARSNDFTIDVNPWVPYQRSWKGRNTTTFMTKKTLRNGPNIARTSDQTCGHAGGICLVWEPRTGDTRTSIILSLKSAEVSGCTSDSIGSFHAGSLVVRFIERRRALTRKLPGPSNTPRTQQGQLPG
jgi:hypothetical protein